MDNMNKSGLEGLGNINTNNASPTLQTPGIMLNKTDADSNKLVTNYVQFDTSEKLAAYIKDWLKATGLVSVEETAKENEFSVYLGSNYGTCTVICLIGLENIRNMLDVIYNAGNTCEIGSKKVILSYSNFDDDIISKARPLGVELVGTAEIYDINGAIENGYRQLPYYNIKMNTFAATLSKALCDKYTADSRMKNGSFGDVEGQKIKSEASNLANDLTSAFSEGFGMIKESLGSLFKGNKQNNVAPGPQMNGFNGQAPQAPQMGNMSQQQSGILNSEIKQPLGNGGVNLEKEVDLDDFSDIPDVNKGV